MQPANSPPERDGSPPDKGLRIRMLGQFECWRAGSPIPREAWRTRPTLTLLKFLLDERNHRVSVDRLVDAIWPESNPASARQSLQVAVRTLRLALEPSLERGSESRFVRTEPDGYRFDASRCVVDVDLFEAASQRALVRSDDLSVAERIAALEGAAASYGGEFLADDPYSDWALGSRERLRARYLDVLDALSSSLSAAGEWERALEWLEEALTLDPYREELYRRLMRAHAARSRRSHALAAFERCKTVLVAELGVEPAIETLRLREEIVAGHLTGGELTAPDRVGFRHSPNELRFPFVGRSVELEGLERALRRSAVQAGIVAAVAGPPGVGKTRLVQEFIRRHGHAESMNTTAEWRSLWIDSHEAEQRVPFAPLARLLAGFFERSPSAADRQKLAPFAPPLARLVPQAQTMADDQRYVQAPFEIGQLLEAATQAVRVMMRGDAGIIIVDDLQWSDTSTLLWLSYALNRLGPRFLVVVSYRSGEIAESDAANLVADARRAGRLVEVSLGGLGVTDVDQLLAVGLQDVKQRDQLSRHIHERTGGQPLFVVETLRCLLRDGQLVVGDGGNWSIGETEVVAGQWSGTALLEIVGDRVQRLSQNDRVVFQTLCVIGVESRPQLISAASGMPIDVVLAALDSLLEDDLIRVSSDGRSYVVAHPVVREVVYDGLSPARRQALHLRVAEALLALRDRYPISPGQALQHLIEGDAPLPEIAEVAEEAGDVAMRQSVIGDALEYYELALQYRDEQATGVAGPTTLAPIIEKRADALAAAGRWDAAIEEFEKLQFRGEAFSRSRASRKLGVVLGDVRGEFERALAIFDEAELALEAAKGDAEESQIEIERGRIDVARATAHFYRSDYDQVVTYGSRGLARLEGRAGAERDEIELLVRIGSAEQRLGRLDGAEARYRAAIAGAAVHGDPALEARLRDSLGSLMFTRGQLSRALEVHRQTASTGRTLGVPRLEIAGLVNTANALNYLARLNEARSTWEVALRRARELEAQYTVMHALVGFGETLLRLGEMDEARTVLDEGIRLSEEIQSAQRRAHAFLHFAEIEFLEENHEGALVWAKRGLRTGEDIGDMHSRREGLPLLARILLRLGHREEAESAARQGLELAIGGGFTLSAARNHHALGEVLYTSSPEDGRAFVEEAESVFRRAGAQYELAQTLLSIAGVDSDQARRRELLAEARALAARRSMSMIEAITNGMLAYEAELE